MPNRKAEDSTGKEMHKVLKETIKRIGEVGCTYLSLEVHYDDCVNVSFEIGEELSYGHTD